MPGSKRLLPEPPTSTAASLVDVPTAPEATLVDLVLGIPGAASRVHGLLELGCLSPHALAQRTELGLHDAQRLLAALELGRRVHAARSRRPRRLRSPRDIARFFEPTLAPLVHEELWMAALDVHHGLRRLAAVAGAETILTDGKAIASR
ncbi:hypothetical protein WMF20_00700 [Sorangium sp. So ce834]|uniref:hypothetical protein n=1 Tax=Sorangium sp. So ce834 TaxID=3133321 RepID=UPI003F612694